MPLMKSSSCSLLATVLDQLNAVESACELTVDLLNSTLLWVPSDLTPPYGCLSQFLLSIVRLGLPSPGKRPNKSIRSLQTHH